MDDLAVEANLDTGTPIQKVRNPKVFRIREQDERAAVWYDSTHGVVWFCRVLAIADFPNEPKLYEHFGRLEGDTNKRPPWPSVLLPSDQERREAGGQQRLESIIVALAAARDTAFASPRTWCPGFIRRPTAKTSRWGGSSLTATSSTKRANSSPASSRHPLVPAGWASARCYHHIQQRQTDATLPLYPESLACELPPERPRLHLQPGAGASDPFSSVLGQRRGVGEQLA